jgi:hypothetical protein
MAGMWFLWVTHWIIVLRGLGTGDGVTLGVGGVQILAGLAVMRLQSGMWVFALREMIAMPAACVLFLAMAGMGLVARGAMWKGRVIPTAQRLPPWQPQPPQALTNPGDAPRGHSRGPGPGGTVGAEVIGVARARPRCADPRHGVFAQVIRGEHHKNTISRTSPTSQPWPHWRHG